MTVGELKRLLFKVPDDALILIPVVGGHDYSVESVVSFNFSVKKGYYTSELGSTGESSFAETQQELLEYGDSGFVNLHRSLLDERSEQIAPLQRVTVLLIDSNSG